jgi:hypothetical protein
MAAKAASEAASPVAETAVPVAEQQSEATSSTGPAAEEKPQE